MGGHHGQGHTPFSESGGHIPAAVSAGEAADIGEGIQGYAVLGRPAAAGDGPWKQAAGSICQVPVRVRPGQTCAVALAAQKEGTFEVSDTKNS